MTKREQIATACLAGLCSNSEALNPRTIVSKDFVNLPEMAIGMADLLLEKIQK